MANNDTPVMETREATDRISRGLLSWLNTWPGKQLPIAFEDLPSDAPGMALSSIQGAYIVKRYLRGRYEGQYQYKILYRLQPTSSNARLTADETLDALGDWASSEASRPSIGQNKTVKRIVCNTRAAMVARYEDGSEDHQILMTMEYHSA